MKYSIEQLLDLQPKTEKDTFMRFIENNFNIDVGFVGLAMKELEDGKMLGTKNNLTIEQLQKVFDDGFIKTDKGTYIPIPFEQATHYELRLRHTENILCVDVDGILENGDCCLTDVWGIPNMKEVFLECSYTLSRKKKLPHFYFKVVGLDTQSLSNTYVDCFKDFKGDLLVNHCWEKIEDNHVYNYDDYGLLYIHYNDLKKLLKTDVLEKEEPKPITNKSFSNSNELVGCLLNIISIEYLTNYSDWTKIVWSAKNCGASKEQVIEVSKRASNYSDNGFENVWKSDYPSYTLGTLKYYAKQSNQEEYYNIVQNKEINFSATEIHSDYSWATLFKRLCGDNFIYQDGQLYVYHQNKWRVDDKNRFIKKQIQDTLIEFLNHYKSKCMNVEFSNKDDVDKFKENTKSLASCMKTICTISQINSITENFITILVADQADLKNVFDDKPYMFCFNNKSFDLKTGEEIIVKKEDYIIENTSYDYNEPTEEQYKTIEKLFIQIFPNPEIRKCYLSVLFMGMTGIQVEKFFLANGCGRNGKGLINDLFAKMMGNDYYYKLSADVLTSKSDLSKGANPQVANMDNKRCIISSEPDDDAFTKIRMNIIKEITGCGEISARQLYSSKTIVRMKQVQILECNKKPQLSGRMDPAVMDRIIDIPFESYFTANQEEWDDEAHIYPIDSYYKSTEFQASHKTALFKFILDNSPKELYIPDIIKDRSKKYVMNNDELYDWFTETYESTNDDSDILKMKDVYKIFQDSELYCSKTKEQKRMLNYKGFIEYISTSIAFKGKYKNDMKRINGVTYSERIVKYKLKEVEDEEEL
jgi:phage/plasmid-associated DNA primase